MLNLPDIIDADFGTRFSLFFVILGSERNYMNIGMLPLLNFYAGLAFAAGRGDF